MIRRSYQIPLRADQPLLFIPIGDVHHDTPECDRARLRRLIEWVQKQERAGALVRFIGLGDYLDFTSPSEKRHLGAGELHETTYTTIDKAHLGALREFLAAIEPIRHCFLGLLTGHHHHLFYTQAGAGSWKGRSSDEWLAKQLGCDYWGTGVALVRILLPHRQHLDVLALHGAGSAQTPGGRVQKRIRFSEIAPTAHIVVSGHDNAKLAYPRSGLDYEHGMIKRYVVGSGSFQRAYLDQNAEAGYAERAGLVPADLGVVVMTIRVEERNGKWRTDYHASV